jgi:hypothetical protein
MKISPKSEALAFRIWAYAHPKEWDVLLTDVAKDLNVSIAQVRWVVTAKRWNSRFRGLSRFYHPGTGGLLTFHSYYDGSYDQACEELPGYESNERMM